MSSSYVESRNMCLYTLIWSFIVCSCLNYLKSSDCFSRARDSQGDVKVSLSSDGQFGIRLAHERVGGFCTPLYTIESIGIILLVLHSGFFCFSFHLSL